MRPTTVRSAALVLAVAIAAGGCTTKRTVAPTPRPVGPAPEGTVRFGYPVEPPTLNPVSVAGASAATRDVLRPLLPALFRLDETLTPQPDLAAAWPSAREITLDPFTVDIRLRTATWSDGAPITAADVRFSWERLRDGPTGERYRFLTNVRVASPRRLQLVFDRPVRRWWALFSIDDMVLPAHAFGDGTAWDRTVPVSGGAFVMEGWTEGLAIRLRRRDDYWGSPAGVAAIEIVFVGDDEFRLELTGRGELDAFFAQGEGNIGARAGARGWPVVDGALDGAAGTSGAWGPAWLELQLARDRIPEPVAKAIGTALDRTLAVELFDDSGQAMNGMPARFPGPTPRASPMPDGLPEIRGPWDGVGADPRAAEAVLSAAGYRRSGDVLDDPRGRPVELKLAFASSPSGASGVARWIHFALRPLGIRVEVIGVDGDRFERDWLPNRLADAYVILRRGADAPDTSAYLSGAPPSRNPSRVADADASIDDAESAVRRTRLGDERVTGLGSAAWTKAQEALRTSGLVYPLVRVRTWVVSRGGVRGPRATGTSAGPLWNAADWGRTGP